MHTFMSPDSLLYIISKIIILIIVLMVWFAVNSSPVV
jgi:hypothetical protein